jgi:histidyl-tRNA synthetase
MKVIQKPNNARGTRDFGPKEMALRNYVFSIIRKHFEAFGSCDGKPFRING